MASLKLDPDELEKIGEWNTEHLRDVHGGEEPYSGAIGGRLSFEIIGTSLGQITRVNCLTCKNTGKDLKVYSKDVTNYDHW